MHGRKGRHMMNFDDVLIQYEPMISATLRKLNIYRNHETFRQAGRIALWQAWTRYEEGKGHFAPFASQSIRGAMLDELKKENRFEKHHMQTEDEIMSVLREIEQPMAKIWSDRIEEAFEQLTSAERMLVQWLFVEGLTQVECAEKAGISVAGVKKRRERMILKLRNIL